MWMVASTDGTRTRSAAMLRDPAQTRRVISQGSKALGLCAGTVVLALVLFSEGVAAGKNAAYPPRASAASSTPAQAAAEAQSEAGQERRAYFGRERASREARQIADWIVHSADNLGLPFVIVDKIDARIFVFDAGGRIRGASPALVGQARGDDTVPGIGDRAYSDMPPETRITPAGRFVAAKGMNTRGEDVVWVDYDAAVDIHRVVTNKPKERRLERLATPTPLDNRISYGCINVPARFYETVVSPVFSVTDGIVYVLPETRAARELFGAYDVEERIDHGYAAGQAGPPK